MSGLNHLLNLDRKWCVGGDGYSLYADHLFLHQANV